MIHPFKRSRSYIRVAILLLFLGAGSCPPDRSALGLSLSHTHLSGQERKAVYILHGINDSPDNPGLLALKATIKAALPQVDAYCVSMPNGKLIKERLAEARQFIHQIESKEKHDALFLVGYSLGGLLAADLATEWEKEKNIKGIVTINAPMGGIQLDVKDHISLILVEIITSDLRTDKHVLQPDSSYLNHVRLRVQQSTIPLLSIGSTCQITNQADTRLRSGMLPMDSLKKNITDTDIILKLSSQLAVQHWECTKKHVAVKPYENYAHKPDISFPFVGKVTDAPSILENQEMKKLVARFVGDPDGVVKELNVK